MAVRSRINASVKRFQRVMAALPEEVARKADEILAAQAASLAGEIRAAAPQGPTGNLKRSVRVVKGKKALRYYVVAGGALTTEGAGTFTGEFMRAFARGSRGKALGVKGPYDYARAVEFGTADGRPARPFFYSTYRKRKRAMKRYLAEQCAKALKDGFNNA